MKKICSDCKEEKNDSDFSKRTDGPWFSSSCKTCMVKRVMEWRKKNQEKYNLYQNDYHKKRYAAQKSISARN